MIWEASAAILSSRIIVFGSFWDYAQNQRPSIPYIEINLKEQLKDNVLYHFDT